MEPLAPLLHWGPLIITRTTLTSWGILLILAVLCRLLTRNLSVEQPGLIQTALEGAVQAVSAAIEAVLPGRTALLLPFVATLWLYLAIANLTGLIPGLHSPTADLSTTAALAVLVFLSVPWFGIRAAGWKSYLHHYLSPSPLLLPFHLLGEFSRTLALAIRLFGNIMSLEMAALLILLVAGFLVPIPILMLHIIEALVQAYIFGMLTLIYLAGGMQAQLHSNVTQPASGRTP